MVFSFFLKNADFKLFITNANIVHFNLPLFCRYPTGSNFNLCYSEMLITLDIQRFGFRTTLFSQQAVVVGLHWLVYMLYKSVLKQYVEKPFQCSLCLTCQSGEMTSRVLVVHLLRMAVGRRRQEQLLAIDVRECGAQASVGAGLARLVYVSISV